MLNYQIQGIQWIKNLPPYCAGILADEMGLGKTRQALLAFNEICKNVLIITKKSIITTWLNEAKIFNIHIEQDINKYKGGFLIINYNQIANINNIFKQKLFDGLIIDEIYAIQNILSSLHNELRGFLLKQSPQKILILSGTPFKNNIFELLFLMNDLNIDVRNQIRQSTLFQQISLRQLLKYKHYRGKSTPEIEQIMKYINDKYILRRTRKELKIELPPIYVNFIDLNQNLWQQLYLDLITNLTNKRKIKNWTAIQRKKQVLLSPYLINKYNFVLPTTTPKIYELLDIIKQHKSQNHKIIIFSQYKRFLEYLINNHLRQYNVAFISGDVPLSQRQLIVDNFSNNQYDILCLTIKTGAEGLNLQTANVVIFTDLWWTYADVIQAINRIYRMQQTKECYVYLLNTPKTIEDKIINIIARKQTLFHTYFK